MIEAKPPTFWSPAAAATLLFAWFVVFIEAGTVSDTQRVAAVLIGATAAVFGGVALDRLQIRRSAPPVGAKRRRVEYTKRYSR